MSNKLSSWERAEAIERLAELLEKTETGRWEELEHRLEAGTLGELDRRLKLPPLDGEEGVLLFEAAREQAERGMLVVRHRRLLHQQIEATQAAIARALQTVETLDEALGDPEYQGGHADTEHYLNEAARSLRAAQRVKPTDKDGRL